MLKIVIADDHEIIRDGLKTFLTEENGFCVVDEAKNGAEAISKALNLSPDVVIMDISMPLYNGIEALEHIMNVNKYIKVLMFSMYSDPSFITDSYHKGAYGFLVKDAEKEEMLMALRKVGNGEKYFSPSVANTLLDHMEKDFVKLKTLQLLTKRELEILKLLKSGLNNEQIAEQLYVSRRTVDTHKTNIKSKLEVKNSSKLITLAYELGL